MLLIYKLILIKYAFIEWVCFHIFTRKNLSNSYLNITSMLDTEIADCKLKTMLLLLMTSSANTREYHSLIKNIPWHPWKIIKY